MWSFLVGSPFIAWCFLGSWACKWQCIQQHVPVLLCLFCGLTVRFVGSQFSAGLIPAIAVKARNLTLGHQGELPLFFLRKLFIFGCSGSSVLAFCSCARGATLSLRCLGCSLLWLLLPRAPGLTAFSGCSSGSRSCSVALWCPGSVASPYVGSSHTRD